MELIRKREVWDPFNLLNDLQTDINRVFNRSLTRENSWVRNFNPAVEIDEEKDKFLVHTDLPGLKKEDLEISVKGNLLTIQGERKNKSEKRSEGYHYSECSYGSFSRSVELPAEVIADKVNATYKNGVLEIVLPKSENAQKKQIDIKVE
ncbi:MAG: Hsp20/alpha crystallin family protein [Candidatus Omnitrophica bacterium]|nr:Hsp20/alpha crystallin family protein [Candidatus Omnitrophota bacterium]